MHISTQKTTSFAFVLLVVLVVQRFGVGVVIERSLVRLPAGALSSQLGQLSLPSIRVPACMARVRRGAFTCVGWKVTLCDPIWQVTSRSSEVGIPSGRATPRPLTSSYKPTIVLQGT